MGYLTRFLWTTFYPFWIGYTIIPYMMITQEYTKDSNYNNNYKVLIAVMIMWEWSTAQL